MSNAHHKIKTLPRRDLNRAESVRDAARVKELARSAEADTIEAAMPPFEDAVTTDGGHLRQPRPVSSHRSLTGGSLR